MADLYIAEYAILPQMPGGQPMITPEPAIATQKVSYTGTAGRSSAFNAQTRYIGITSPGIFSYAVGGSTIDATTSHFRVPADQIIFMAVQPGAYISAITNT
jgi:hypothetical protein